MQPCEHMQLLNSSKISLHGHQGQNKNEFSDLIFERDDHKEVQRTYLS